MGEAEAAIAERYRLMAPQLNERQRRRFAASEARIFGRGGIAAAARACGLAENTVRKGRDGRRGDRGRPAGDQHRHQKKELVGAFKTAGREWRPAGRAPRVNTYDFPSMAEGK